MTDFSGQPVRILAQYYLAHAASAPGVNGRDTLAGRLHNGGLHLNTYYPVPGHTHLKVLLPAPSNRAAPPAPFIGPSGDTPTFSPLIRVALDAAFGIRDIKTLQKRAFAPMVRTYVRARRTGGLPPGIVQVSSSRRRGQEYYGTAESEGERYAWVARVNANRLVSFRVL